MSRTLRSVPQESTDAVSYIDSEEEELLLVPQAEVENVKAIFAVGQKNHTPDFQRVEQPDPETGVNSNSSADFPSGQATQGGEVMPDSGGGVESTAEGSIDAMVASVTYEVPGSKENWIDLQSTSVILQQHRSDEM